MILTCDFTKDGILTNYYHMVNNCLMKVVAYMKTHKLKKENTYLYIDSTLLKAAKGPFVDFFSRFIQITHIQKDLTYIDKVKPNISTFVKCLDSIKSPPKKLDTIVYVKRTGRRHITNDDEIIKYIQTEFGNKYKIVVVQFEKMSFQEQVDRMNGCVLLVGCHGAGFTNTLFMEAGSSLLELFPESFHTNCFETICKAKKINYYSLHGISSRRPPFSLKKYKSVMKTKKYDNSKFRSSIRDITFRINAQKVIHKIKEIL